MKKIIFYILIINFSLLYSQNNFQLNIGGTANDYARCIIQTPDGSYAIAGSGTFATAYSDLCIIKLSSTGAMQWTRIAGISLPFDEISTCLTQSNDGGYVIGGYKQFGTFLKDPLIVRFNAAGVFEWSKSIEGFDDHQIASLINTNDGGYAYAGTKSGQSTGYDAVIVKMDANANIQWSKIMYGDTSYDAAKSVIQTSDGGFALAGFTLSFGGYPKSNMYIVRLNAQGSLLWSGIIGGALNDEANCIIKTTDDGFVLAGKTESFGAGSSDMYIIKLSSAGALQWTRTVGMSTEESAYSIIQTSDGGYAAVGYSLSGNYDIYIVKLDAYGTYQWSKKIGGTSHERAYSIIQTSDGGYAVAGYTWTFGFGYSDMYLVKLDVNGNTCGNTAPALSLSGSGGTLTTVVSNLNNTTLTLVTEAPNIYSGGDISIICYVGIDTISNNIPRSYELHQNYPNPFNPKTKIRFEIPPLAPEGGQETRLLIYNSLGQKVETLVNDKLDVGTYEVEFDGTDYPSGVYFYQLTTLNYSETKKMLLIK